MGSLNEIKQSVIASFLERTKNIGGLALAKGVKFYQNSTEEIREAAKSGRPIRMFAAGHTLAVSGGAKARLEENYLFDTRRFPTFVSGESFPANIASGDYMFFQNAVGQPAINNGFGSAIVAMTELETNMDVAGQIAQGKNFVFNQIGISFNADAASADIAVLMEMGALRYEKQGGQTTLRHGPVRQWPGGTGVAGFSGATNVGQAGNGIADIRATRKLAIPRVIREKESFAYKYVVPRNIRNTNGSTSATTTATVTAATLMTIWLWGGQQDAIPV